MKEGGGSTWGLGGLGGSEDPTVHSHTFSHRLSRPDPPDGPRRTGACHTPCFPPQLVRFCQTHHAPQRSSLSTWWCQVGLGGLKGQRPARQGELHRSPHKGTKPAGRATGCRRPPARQALPPPAMSRLRVAAAACAEESKAESDSYYCSSGSSPAATVLPRKPAATVLHLHSEKPPLLKTRST